MKICGVEINHGREAEPGKHCCNGCPCTYTDESEQISNYGCLPDFNKLIEFYLEGRGIWKCHSKNKPCGGLIQVLKLNNIPMDKNNELLITEDNPWIERNQKWGTCDK